MNTFFKSKVLTAVALLCFVSMGNVYPQQASTVSEAVSSVGQNTGHASAGLAYVDPGAQAIRPDINPYNIKVPEAFGNIEEVFQGSPNSPLIVHIQNVHANYEAQVNIKNILSHLAEKEGFSLIQVEGAVSKLDPTILQPSYLKEANLKLVDFLMREGRITGADAFAVETDKPVELYGVEDYSLYMENLKMFKAIYKHQAEVKPYFDEVHRLILNIGPKLLNPELLDFTRKTEEFSGDKIDILDYLVYMNKLSEKHHLTSIGDMKEIIHYPNLVRLMRLQKLEEELNKSGLKKEMEALKLEFQKKMPESKQTEELLSHLDETAKGVNPRNYFLELTKLADEAKIDFIGYPALRIFAEFSIHQDEIDHRGLFTELKQFENYLQEKLFTADDEKSFLQIISFVGLLEQYFRLEMSREKLVLYLKERDEIKPSWIMGRVQELAQKYEVSAKPTDDLEKLDSYMSELEYFYQLVLKRDEIFTEKITSKMKLLNQDKTVIITGGFHKDGLVDYFRKENISYVIINPKVDVKQGSENYLKVMLDEDAVVGSVFAGTFALEIKALIDNGVLGDIDRRELSNFYAAATPQNFLLDTRPQDEIIKETNNHFREVAVASGVLVKVTSTKVAEKQVELTLEAQFYKEDREPHRYSLKVSFSGSTQHFTVNEIKELRSTPELKNLGIRPPEAPQPTIINREKLSSLNQIARFPVARLTAPPSPDQFIKQSVLFQTLFVPLPQTPVSSDLTPVIPRLTGLSPRKVRLFYDAAARMPIPEALSTVESRSELRLVNDSDIAKANLLNEVSRKQLGFFSNMATSKKPSVPVIPILEGDDVEARLRFVANVVSEEGTAAIVYGKRVNKIAEGLDIKPEILTKIKLIDMKDQATDREILEKMFQDLKNHKFSYDLYQRFVHPFTNEELATPQEYFDKGYIRVLLPEEDTAIAVSQYDQNIDKTTSISSAISSISKGIPQLVSAVRRKAVINSKLTEAFAGLEVELLRRLPRLGEETEFKAETLVKFDLVEIIVGKGLKWGFARGVEELVGKLFADYQKVMKISSAA